MRIIFGLLLILSACAADNSITIGVSLPQTGFASTMGEYVHHGIKLAYENLSKEEQKIKLIFEDDQCNPTTGISVAHKLVETDNSKFILGPFCAAVITSTIDYYDQHKIIRMITGLGADTYAEKGVYRFILLGEVKDLMKPLAEYSSKHGLQKIGIIYLDDDYGRENMLYFEKWFEQAGGKVIAKEPFVRNDKEFRTQLLKIRDKNVDGVLIVAVGSHLVEILREMNALNFDVLKYGLRNVEDPEILSSASQELEGVFFPSLTPPNLSDGQKEFAKKYLEKYRKPAESVAANAFDSFNILYSAILKCGQDVDCVDKQIRDIKEYEGVSGKFSIDEKGVAVREPVVRVVKNETFELAD